MAALFWDLRPVSAAPKDRTIVAYDPEYPWDSGFCLCNWEGGRIGPHEYGVGWFATDQQTGETWLVEPVHWCELPALPKV